jgi:hypothetical protein
MVAARHLKMAAGIGVCACFDVFDPGAVYAQRNFVFAFAGGGAGMTTNALAVVNDKSIIFRGRTNGEWEIFCHNILVETVAETNKWRTVKSIMVSLYCVPIMRGLWMDDNQLVLILRNSCGIITKSLQSLASFLDE